MAKPLSTTGYGPPCPNAAKDISTTAPPRQTKRVNELSRIDTLYQKLLGYTTMLVFLPIIALLATLATANRFRVGMWHFNGDSDCKWATHINSAFETVSAGDCVTPDNQHGSQKF